MKKLSEINEGTLWGNTILRSDTDLVRKEDEITEEYVRSFIFSDKYSDRCKAVTIRKENGKPVVDIEGDYVFREDITEMPFQFGIVTGFFRCDSCPNLTSLEGCPKEVGDSFDCACCGNLHSLEGCPKKVGGDFYCSGCLNLHSLSGCPKEVGGEFYCYNCGKKFTEEEVMQNCDVKGRINI